MNLISFFFFYCAVSIVLMRPVLTGEWEEDDLFSEWSKQVPELEQPTSPPITEDNDHPFFGRNFSSPKKILLDGSSANNKQVFGWRLVMGDKGWTSVGDMTPSRKKQKRNDGNPSDECAPPPFVEELPRKLTATKDSDQENKDVKIPTKRRSNKKVQIEINKTPLLNLQTRSPMMTAFIYALLDKKGGTIVDKKDENDFDITLTNFTDLCHKVVEIRPGNAKLTADSLIPRNSLLTWFNNFPHVCDLASPKTFKLELRKEKKDAFREVYDNALKIHRHHNQR